MKIEGARKNKNAVLSWDDCVVKDDSGNQIEDILEAHIHIVGGKVAILDIVTLKNAEDQEPSRKGAFETKTVQFAIESISLQTSKMIKTNQYIGLGIK